MNDFHFINFQLTLKLATNEDGFKNFHDRSENLVVEREVCIRSMLREAKGCACLGDRVCICTFQIN